jgi:hypothetical protein
MLRVDRLTNALVRELQGWNEDLTIKVDKYTTYNIVYINEYLYVMVEDTLYNYKGKIYNPEEVGLLVEDVLNENF